MTAAGAAWGAYTLMGKGSRAQIADPVLLTAGNFLGATWLGLILIAGVAANVQIDLWGLVLAATSGALASGVGYAIWYTTLKWLSSVLASILQLSVPLLSALGAVFLLGEQISLRLFVAAVLILGGLGLSMVPRTVSMPSSNRGSVR
jgi:drug/metabolite transporter (DMT)-like permease